MASVAKHLAAENIFAYITQPPVVQHHEVMLSPWTPAWLQPLVSAIGIIDTKTSEQSKMSSPHQNTEVLIAPGRSAMVPK